MAVSPVSEDETVLGETVGDLQQDIAIANGEVGGLSKYVDGFTQFSSNPAEQHGNYIVLHAEAESGSTIQYQSVYRNGTLGNLVTLDSDGIIVVRLTENTARFKFVATKNGTSNVLYYGLDGLTLEDPEAFSISLAAGGHCTKSGAYQVYEGESATITLAADTGYELPSSISVVGASHNYDQATGVVVLSAPTANITVTCVCTAIEYVISASVTNGSYSGASSIAYGGTAQVTIAANSGYELPSSVTVSGASYTYDDTTGIISLSNPTGAVSISAECTAEQPVGALTPIAENSTVQLFQFDTSMYADGGNTNEITPILAAWDETYWSPLSEQVPGVDVCAFMNNSQGTTNLGGIAAYRMSDGNGGYIYVIGDNTTTPYPTFIWADGEVQSFGITNGWQAGKLDSNDCYSTASAISYGTFGSYGDFPAPSASLWNGIIIGDGTNA